MMSKLALVWTATATVNRIVSAGRRLELDTQDGSIFVSPAQAGWEGHGWRLMEIVPFDTPDGQRRVGGPSYEVGGDAVTETYQVEDIPPFGPTDLPLNNWRFHWMVGKLGLDPYIRGAIAQIENEDHRSIALARYEKSAEYNRDDATLNQLAAAIGMSAETLDAAWMTAATVAV